MRKIRTIFLAAFFVVFGAKLFALEATVTFVSGKVEVQREGKWVALQKGDSLAKTDTISTGFQSEAKIKIMDSVLYLGPITRITLEELSSSNQQDNVNVFLKTGTTRSQVRHTDNKRVNYQVHTAVAVASCRGTEWVIDDSNNVDCSDGILEVSALDGIDAKKTTVVLVKANQSVRVTDLNGVELPVNNAAKNATEVVGSVNLASEDEAEGGAGFGNVNIGGNAADNKMQTATLLVIVQVPSEE